MVKSPFALNLLIQTLVFFYQLINFIDPALQQFPFLIVQLLLIDLLNLFFMLHQVSFQLQLVLPLKVGPSLSQLKVELFDLLLLVLDLICLLVELFFDDAGAIVPCVERGSNVVFGSDLDVLV